METQHIEVKTFSQEGDPSVAYERMTKEDFEMLKALNVSPYWKHYRQILIKAKEAYFNSVLPMKDPHDMIKHVGLVAGINFAINQLPILVAQYDAKILKQMAEKEKPPVRPRL